MRRRLGCPCGGETQQVEERAAPNFGRRYLLIFRLAQCPDCDADVAQIVRTEPLAAKHYEELEEAA